MRSIFAVIVSVLAALSLSGCGTDTPTTPTPAAACTPATCNIVQQAQDTPSLSTLVDSLISANLTEILSGTGPFTVFAPTNAAFAAISDIVGSLTPEALSDVLTYHVVAARALSKDLTNGEILPTVFTDHAVTVDLSELPTVKITGETNTVTVTIANVECTNGVVHIVDAVLIPTLPAAACTPTTCNIVQQAQDTPSLSTLVDSLISANLVETLSSVGPFTVFAPTNAAFDAISDIVGGLTPEALSDVLTYHVVAARALSTDLTNGEILPTVFTDHAVTVDLSELPTVKITGETNTVTVTIANVECTNGVVHVVDAVLVPNGLPSVLALSV